MKLSLTLLGRHALEYVRVLWNVSEVIQHLLSTAQMATVVRVGMEFGFRLDGSSPVSTSFVTSQLRYVGPFCLLLFEIGCLAVHSCCFCHSGLSTILGQALEQSLSVNVPTVCGATFLSQVPFSFHRVPCTHCCHGNGLERGGAFRSRWAL